jgi:hypothetical protein
MLCFIGDTKFVHQFTLKCPLTRLEYLDFPNPYLKETLLLALLQVFGLATATAVSNQLDPLSNDVFIN